MVLLRFTLFYIFKVKCLYYAKNYKHLQLLIFADYGKHLLYRRKDDRFIVKNDSILPIKWKIRNADDFLEDFIISQTSGIIPRYDNQVVPVTYIACRVGVISHKMLTVDVSMRNYYLSI